MAMHYVINNIIDEDSICCTSKSADDGFFDQENLYNKRPSKPFRFEGPGIIGTPEWICVAPVNSGDSVVTFAGIFNHNLALTAVGDELRLKGCNDPCEDPGVCDWDNPGVEIDLAPRLVDGFRNLYRELNQDYPSWRLDIIDQNNEDGFGEIGELVLGQYSAFPSGVHVQGGQPDGPQFHAIQQETQFGQDWSSYLAESGRIGLEFMDINNPANMNEMRLWVRAVMQNNGKFILIDDHQLKFCYYCMIKNLADYTKRIIHNPLVGELRSWTFDLKVLTEGLRLL